jgi:hypothetical protein
LRWLECLIMLMTAVVLLLMGMSYYLSCYCSRTEGSRPTSSKTIGKKSRALAESARLASTSYSRLLSDFKCGHHMPAYHVDHLNDCLFDRTMKVTHAHDRKRSLYTMFSRIANILMRIPSDLKGAWLSELKGAYSVLLWLTQICRPGDFRMPRRLKSSVLDLVDDYELLYDCVIRRMLSRLSDYLCLFTCGTLLMVCANIVVRASLPGATALSTVSASEFQGGVSMLLDAVQVAAEGADTVFLALVDYVQAVRFIEICILVVVALISYLLGKHSSSCSSRNERYDDVTSHGSPTSFPSYVWRGKRTGLIECERESEEEKEEYPIVTAPTPFRDESMISPLRMRGFGQSCDTNS